MCEAFVLSVWMGVGCARTTIALWVLVFANALMLCAFLITETIDELTESLAEERKSHAHSRVSWLLLLRWGVLIR
jgi:hypothetical protein